MSYKYRNRNFPEGYSKIKISAAFRILSLILIVILIQVTNVQAQEKVRVSGKVISDTERQGVPGVNVLVKGTSFGTITDIDGNYVLEANSTDVLVFTYIGYISEEVVVGNKSVLNITLIEDLQSLDEVIVVGYGTQRKSDLTGAVASVSGEKMRGTVTTNIDQALQGRVAGVQVTQNSGQPGGAVSIRIRGTNSITGSNEPLYVIDGIQFQGNGTQTSGFDWAGGAGGQTRVNPLAAISPSDIVSIEVLKDASATAIYGSRAANGVVMITTRRGKAGEAKISYEGFHAVQSLPRKVDMMNLPQYAEYQSQVLGTIEGAVVNPRYLDPSLLGPGTDWQDEVFRSAPMKSHQLSISGGSEKTQYAIMGGFFKQDGIIIGSGFERFNTRINIDNKVKDWFKMGASLSFANTEEIITLNDGGDGVISQALQMPPDVPARDINGNFGGPPIGQGSADISANPVGLAMMRNNTLKRQRIMANFYGELELLKGLNFRSEIGFDNNHGLGKAFNPTYEWGAIRNDVNELLQREDNSFFWLFKNYLTYNRTFGIHNLTAMVGTEAQRSQYEGSTVYKTGFASNDIIVLNQGVNSLKNTTGYFGSSTLASYFGRFNYNYADRYLATFTLRADGSSRFGPNNKWGYFPSASFAWRIANEAFMPKTNLLSDLKLRAGYGEVGNQEIANYAYGSAMASYLTWEGTGYMNNRIANPDVKWESTAQYNIGVDASFFGGRIDLTVELYKKFTKDLLLQVALPDYMGDMINAPYANVGKMENEGVEFSLVTRNVASEKFSWNTDFNFTANRNMVKDIDRVYTRNLYWYTGFGDVTRTFSGNPVGMFYGYVMEGIFTSEQEILDHAVQVSTEGSERNFIHHRDGVWIGDVKFKDLNGDGVINEQDKTLIGNPNPKFTYGFNNNFTFGPFDLSIFLQGSYGADIFNFTKVRNESMTSVFNNQSTAIADRAQIELIDPNGSATDISNVRLANPGTNIPRFSQLDVNENKRMSSRWIEDGSYLRIQNIMLAYTLPKSLTQRVRVERFRIYANAQNVYTFTKYSGFDPEIGAFNQDALRQNIDMGRYPMPRIMTLGVNLDF